jgi:Zn finger protein HypA/HybF involved in hydrogenase expression
MGVLEEPDHEYAVELYCLACDTEYWTSWEMSNECPECGARDYKILAEEGDD